jgi:hypothetical protein
MSDFPKSGEEAEAFLAREIEAAITATLAQKHDDFISMRAACERAIAQFIEPTGKLSDHVAIEFRRGEQPGHIALTFMALTALGEVMVRRVQHFGIA